MNALDRLESLLQDLMERPAALLAPKRLHPLQLASALTKELEARALPLVDRVLVPDEYELRISVHDWPEFAGAQARLETELAGYVTRLTAERELSLGAPVRVRLAAESQLRPGEVSASASFHAAAPDEVHATAPSPTVVLEREMPARPERRRHAAPVSRSTTAALVLLNSEGLPLERFPLDRPLMRIGRRSSNEITLSDTKVSREHARIERAGERYFLVDLGSTNGVRINGRDARGRTELNSGDVVEVGLQRLRFEQ